MIVFSEPENKIKFKKKIENIFAINNEDHYKFKNIFYRKKTSTFHYEIKFRFTIV